MKERERQRERASHTEGERQRDKETDRERDRTGSTSCEQTHADRETDTRRLLFVGFKLNIALHVIAFWFCSACICSVAKPTLCNEVGH